MPPTCFCGLFAAGLCVDCSKPGCADHLGRDEQDARYRCETCSNQLAAKRHELATRRQAKERRAADLRERAADLREKEPRAELAKVEQEQREREQHRKAAIEALRQRQAPHLERRERFAKATVVVSDALSARDGRCDFCRLYEDMSRCADEPPIWVVTEASDDVVPLGRYCDHCIDSLKRRVAQIVWRVPQERLDLADRAFHCEQCGRRYDPRRSGNELFCGRCVPKEPRDDEDDEWPPIMPTTRYLQGQG